MKALGNSTTFSPSLFSYSGLHSSAMKALILFFALAIIGCGGIMPPKDNPISKATPTPTPVNSSAQIFSNHAETWEFQNGFGDHMWVEIIPVDDLHTTWHYTKDATEAYWGQGVEQAELWFDLENDGAGNWYSTGGIMNFPLGCSYCVAPVLRQPYAVVTNPGQLRPYLILPANADNFSYQALFNDSVPIGGSDFSGAYNVVDNLTWKTLSYMEFVETPVYTGPAYVSDQWEGPCIHEKWYFAPGLGMVKVAPLDVDGCIDHYSPDPRTAMLRTH